MVAYSHTLQLQSSYKKYDDNCNSEAKTIKLQSGLQNNQSTPIKKLSHYNLIKCYCCCT